MLKEIQTAKTLLPQLELLKQKARLGIDEVGRRPVTLAITSCEAGEGVTTTALNLAASFNHDSRVRILLVDGNNADRGVEKYLRRMNFNNITRIIDVSCRTNWPVHQLTGNVDLLVAKRQKGQSDLNNFFIGMNGEFNSAKDLYEVIILDCPPIRSMYSSLAMFGKVDGVIIVIEAGKIRAEIIERQLALLKESGANILGCVLNKRKFPIPKIIYNRL